MTSMPSSNPTPGQAVNAPPPKKSSMKKVVLAGCGGCLVVLLSLCCIGGYIGYLEEGVSYSAPGDELMRIPIVSGQPISLSYTWDGTGYAFTRYYVDVGASATYSTMVTGSFGCEDYGTLTPTPISATYYGDPDDDHPGYIMVDDDYHRGSPTPVACQGVLDISPPVTSAFLVVTARQRPSDWLAGF